MCLLCEFGVRFAEEEVRMDVGRLAKLISQARLNTHAVQDWEGLTACLSPPRNTPLLPAGLLSPPLGYALRCL